MLSSSFAILLFVACASAQHYNLVYQANSPPVGVVHAPNAADPRHLAHPVVVANAARDAQLPAELTNDFYKNPRIAEGLARESWFTDKEFPVFNRQAEKIPRSEIAKIIKRIRHEERRRRAIYQ